MEMRWLEKVMMNSPPRTWMLRAVEAPRVLGGLDLPEGCTCLEIGCGSGAGAMLIGRYVRPGRLVCVDIDEAMLRRARKRVARPPRWARGAKADAIELRCADAVALPFGEETFDAAFLFGVLHHIDNWPKAIREVARVLKPGGTFAFEEALISTCFFWLSRYYRHAPFGAEELKAALRDAGLELRSFRTAMFGRMCFVRAVKPNRGRRA